MQLSSMMLAAAVLFAGAAQAQTLERSPKKRSKRLAKKKHSTHEMMQVDASADEFAQTSAPVQPMTVSREAPRFFGGSVDAQLGRRWYTTRYDGHTIEYKGTLLTVNPLAVFNFGPIGLGVGPKLTHIILDERDLERGGDADATGNILEAGLQTVGKWNIGRVAPFARAELTAFSAGEIRQEFDDSIGGEIEAVTKVETSGALIGLGTEFAFTKHFKGLAEAQYGMQMLRATGTEIEYRNASGALVEDEDTSENGHRTDFNSASILLGLGANF